MDEVPVHVAILYSTAEAARAVARGRIELRLCATCGMVWNAAYDPGLTDYAEGYDASLHHSPTYQRYLEALAHRLSDDYELAGGLVVEVGCGEGSFLRLLCERARCRGVGIDPSAPSEADSRVEYLCEPLGDHHASLDATLAVSRQMFHYVLDPVGIAARMGRLSERVCIEVPNASWVFASGTVWTVFYEHVAYFGPASLGRALREAGLSVERLEPCYIDGQYLLAIARSGYASGTAEEASGEFLRAVRSFGSVAREQVAQWQSRLDEARPQRVVVWGAAGRGTTFLNACDPDATRVVAVADSNPARQGTYIAGTGHPVIAPEALKEWGPDLLVLTNGTYEAEIRKQVEALGLHPAFQTA